MNEIKEKTACVNRPSVFTTPWKEKPMFTTVPQSSPTIEELASRMPAWADPAESQMITGADDEFGNWSTQWIAKNAYRHDDIEVNVNRIDDSDGIGNVVLAAFYGDRDMLFHSPETARDFGMALLRGAHQFETLMAPPPPVVIERSAKALAAALGLTLDLIGNARDGFYCEIKIPLAMNEGREYALATVSVARDGADDLWMVDSYINNSGGTMSAEHALEFGSAIIRVSQLADILNCSEPLVKVAP